MKNIIRSAYVALVGMLAFTAASCTDDYTYDQPETPSGAQVYFSNELPSQVEIDENANTLTVTLGRAAVGKELSVPIQLTDTTGTFSAPSTAVFGANDSTASVTVTYDAKKMEYDVPVPVSMAITDASLTTVYGSSTYEFNAVKKSPFVSIGTGKFYDNFMFRGPVDVEIMQSKIDPTIYRVMDPYNADAQELGEYEADGNQSPFITLKVLKKGDQFAGVTITQDDLVFFDEINTGYFNTSNDYNQDILLLHPANFKKLATEEYWLHNTVTDYKSDGSIGAIQLAPYYYMDGVGGWNHTQDDGYVQILFPGFEPKDYTATAAYEGRFTDPETNDFAQINVTLGADVDSAKVAVVPATTTTDAAISGIVDGTIPSVTVTTSGTVNVPFDESGSYIIYVITYGGGEGQYVYYTKPVDLTSSKGTAATWDAVSEGLLTVGATDYGPMLFGEGKNGLLYGESFQQAGTLEQYSADETRFRITPFLAEGYPLQFTMDADGVITVDNLYCGNIGAEIYAVDLNTFFASQNQTLKNHYSYYDEANKTLHFVLLYGNEKFDNFYGAEEETFLLDDSEAKALSQAKKVAAKNRKLARKNAPLKSRYMFASKEVMR